MTPANSSDSWVLANTSESTGKINKQEETKMQNTDKFKITTVKYLNGKKLTDYTEKELIDIIKGQGTSITKLQDIQSALPSKSPAINKIISRHIENIKLIESVLNDIV